MSPTQMLRRFRTKVDRRSPYPMFYPFVMTRNEKRVFDEAIAGARYYLEFGMGGSTLRTLQKSSAVVHSVESCPAWIESMQEYAIVRRSLQKRLSIHRVNIGPVKEWGQPVSNEFSHLFPAYSSSVFQAIDCSKIDLVLIDGRFRVACALKTIMECHRNESLRILFHDFWIRENYHVVLKYLDPEVKVDSLGLFAVKRKLDTDSLAKDYKAYQLNPA